MKKFLSKLVMVVLILTLSIGISSVAYAYDDAEVISVNEQYLNSWNTTDFNQYLQDSSLNEESVVKFTNWQALKDQLGAFTAIDETVVNEADGVITAVTTASFENGKLAFTITYDTATVESSGAMSGILSLDATNASTASSSPSMARAGMNILMGMGIVFIVLILISFVISLMKFIPKMLDKSSKEANSNEIHVEKTVETSAVVKEKNLADDCELVAVITAAIMNYEAQNNMTPGGFVVRSIRRRR